MVQILLCHCVEAGAFSHIDFGIGDSLLPGFGLL